MARFGLIPLLACVSVAPSCAAMLKDWQDSHCNYDAAYTAGMGAQRSGASPDATAYGQCTVETRDPSMRGYREGYEVATRAQAQADAVAAKQWQDANCNYDAAFAQGMNAQRSAAALDLAPYGACPEPERAAARRGYRIGYERALAESPPPGGPVVVVAPAATPLVSLLNRMCLDSSGLPDADGTTALQLRRCNGGVGQAFALRPTAEGKINIVHLPSGQCVTTGRERSSDPSRTLLAPCAGAPEQTFVRDELPGRGFKLTNVRSGWCLDVDHDGNADGTRVIHYYCSGRSNQTWTLGGPVAAPPPPPAHDVEVGAIWNQDDAARKCPQACRPPERWTGQWRTTIPGRMSVCGCAI